MRDMNNVSLLLLLCLTGAWGLIIGFGQNLMSGNGETMFNAAGAAPLAWVHWLFNRKKPKAVANNTLVDSSYKDSFDEVALGLAHVDLQGTFIRVNKSLCQFLGYEEDELLKLRFQELTLPEELEESLVFIRGALAGEIRHSFQKVKRYKHKNGQWVWAKLTTTLLRDSNDKPTYFLSSIQDISELKHTENLLKKSEQKLKIIVESISGEIAVWLSQEKLGKTLYVNRGFDEIWGLEAQALYRSPDEYLSQVHEEDVGTLREMLSNPAVHNFELDYRLVDKTGRTRHVHHVGRSIKEDNEIVYFVSSVIDRTKLIERQLLLDDSLYRLKEAYRELQEFSRRDGLTGALNATAFREHLSDAFMRYQRYKTPSTLVFIDIDRFKQVNDSLGHLVGDKALIALVSILSEKIRQTDAVGRYGGDEFMVLLTDSDAMQSAEFCRRIGTQYPVELDSGEQVDIGISIGIRTITDDVTDVDHWMAQADTDMYGQKG